jgi:hypothetical protein
MKRIAGSIVVGMLITSIPLALFAVFPDTHWWKSAAVVCDWPMSLVKFRNLGRNELSRIIFFFTVNIATWSLVAYLVLLGLRKRVAR